jgi:hypothetical protein
MRSNAARFLGILAIIAVAGCGDQPSVTTPTTPAGGTAGRTILLSPTTVNAVTRNTPLAQSVSTSRTIGLFGGTLSIPSAGISVVVPPLALTKSTLITVTAVAGNQVAYEFEPHGITFGVPLIVTQSLVGTSAQGTLLQMLYAGYFHQLSDLNLLNGTAVVTELLNTSVGVGGLTTVFPVFHFSGYLVATGLQSTDDGSSQQ